MVMNLFVIAVLAKISIFLELFALLFHAYVDGLVDRVVALLRAERAIRQVLHIL